MKYAFNDSTILNAAVYNVFDKEVEPTDFNTIGEGRRYWISMSKTF